MVGSGSRVTVLRFTSIGFIGAIWGCETGSLYAMRRVLYEPHFRQGQEKGQHGFRSLVFVLRSECRPSRQPPVWRE